MSVLKYNCSLCCKSDLVVKSDFGLQAIRNTFFAVNKNHFDEAFVKKTKLCVICTHKLQLAVQLKKEYDEMCNRNNNFSPKKCYFCESKATNLINLNDNPNDTHDKINIFLKSVIIRHEYRNLKSCTACLYNLDIWFEVRNNLHKSMNIPTTNSIRNEDATNNNNNVTSMAAAPSPAAFSKRRKQAPRKTAKNRKLSWKNYLHGQLKNLRTADKLMEEKNFVLNSSTIENDEDKLFKSLPFVEIFVSSQITKEKILEDKEGVIPTIVLSDSDSIENNMSKRKPVRLNLSLKKHNTATKNTPKQTKKPKPKIGPKSKKKLFKIKFPIKSKLSLNKSLNDSVLEKDGASDSVLSESSKDASSDDDSNDFLCNVCDKTFTSKCDYLLHDLKHKKFENLIVNVRRDRLCDKLNREDTTLDQTISSAKLKSLVCKWAGEDAVKEFEDEEEVNKEDLKEIGEKSKEDNNKESKEIEITNESPEEKSKDEEISVEMNDLETTDKMEVETTKTSTIEDKNEESGNENDQICNNTNSVEKEIETRNSDLENESCNKRRCSKENDVSDKDSNKKTPDEDSEKEDDENNKKSDAESSKSVDEKVTQDTKKCSDETKTHGESIKNIQVEICLNSEDEMKSENNGLKEQSRSGEKNKSLNIEKGDESVDFGDDFNNSEVSPAPVMSCEDLLNILETNIDSELNENDTKTAEKQEKETENQQTTKKRRRESTEDDVMPKKKKVRFAEKKEVFTPDKSGVVIEKVIENDEFSQDDIDDADLEEEEEVDKEKDVGEPEEETKETKEEDNEGEEKRVKGCENDEKKTKIVNEDVDQVLECEV